MFTLISKHMGVSSGSLISKVAANATATTTPTSSSFITLGLPSTMLSHRFYRTSNVMFQYNNNRYNNNNNSYNNNNGGGYGGGYRSNNYNNNNNSGTRVGFKRQDRDTQQQNDYNNNNNDNNNSGFDFVERSSNRGGKDFNTEQQPIDWSLETLAPIKPIDYKPTEDTSKITVQERELYFKENNISVTSRDATEIPNPIMDFKDTQFPAPVISMLNQKFEKPSIIQSIGWPVALMGRDMIGISQTGSGKTLSFFLPAILHIMSQPRQTPYVGPQVLIVAPTRELTVQIANEASQFLRAVGMRSVTVFGGDDKMKQKKLLYQNRPEVIVGTPGRLIDLMNEGAVILKRVSFVVLDEADRMLEMGFEDQIRAIFHNVRPDRQLLYWTATWPRKVESLAYEFIKNPIKAQVGNGELVANPNIKQNFIMCQTESEKPARLLDTLESIFTERPQAKVLIFTMTKGGADKLCDFILQNGNARIDSIHGDKPQARRLRIIEDFKRDGLDILVATDVASRGLDIRTITDVINFSMPTQIEQYVHRIGRTARAGANGFSHSLLSKTSSSDIDLIPEVVELLGRANQEPPQDLLDAMPRKQYNNNNNNNNFRRGNGGRGYGGRGGNNQFRGSANARPRSGPVSFSRSK